MSNHYDNFHVVETRDREGNDQIEVFDVAAETPMSGRWLVIPRETWMKMVAAYADELEDVYFR